MKTLDEVIKGFECCQEINCAECPYANWDNTDIVRCDPMDKEDDALHYLKAFRDAKDALETEKDRYAEAIEAWNRAMSVDRGLDEWCTDCKEYDQDKQCCHRWNRVIKNVVDEVRERMTWTSGGITNISTTEWTPVRDTMTGKARNENA